MVIGKLSIPYSECSLSALCSYSLRIYAAVLIGRITRLARPSVRPSVCPPRTKKRKGHRLTKISVNVSQGNRCADF